MTVHLHREIGNLKKSILSLGAVVEERVCKAVESFVSSDERLAREVAFADSEIDAMEVAIEEDCLKVLALHQPVAVDLRFIVATLKINNDLERIGDLAVNIAERAISPVPGVRDYPIPADFSEMERKTQAMLRNALDALVNLDTALARKVCDDDDEVDEINRGAHREVNRMLGDGHPNFESAMRLLNAYRHLERIADLATNIAEDVIYMCDGQIVRHQNSANG